jgi:integrase
MLSLWRRHLKSCPHRSKGRPYTKCSCPIWCDGDVDGKRVRKSMDTRDWARATRNLGKIEDPKHGLRECSQPGCNELVEHGRCDRHSREVSKAIAGYLEAHQDAAEGTKASRTRTLQFFQEFTASRGLSTVDEIDLEALNAFRSVRTVTSRTWVKELGTLRHFFRFCFDNEWLFRNWAEKVPMPKNLKPAEREPYKPEEVARIIAACDTIGRGAYERLRATAIVLTLRYTALRISDVALLERNRVRDGEILIRTTKNGKAVRLPVHSDLQAAFDRLPLPREANGPDCPYFFWSGHGSPQSFMRDVTRTMTTVFKASGVPGACSHRFRHTLATEVLEMGGTFEEAADILGDTENIVRKHYAKWSAGRQARISDLLARIWHAKRWPAQVPNESIEWDGGPGEIRTHDLFHAMEARSQLRHRPDPHDLSIYITINALAD